MVASGLAHALVKRGYTVHVLSDQRPFRLGDTPHPRLYFHEVETLNDPILPGNLFALSTTSTLVQLANQYPIDLVNVHYAIPFAPSAVFAREITGKRFKVVTTLHGTDVTVLGNNPSLKATLRYSLEQSDALTAVSDSLAQETRRTFDLSRFKPIHVIPNFVNPERFRFQENPSNGTPVLVHISNFREVKRARDTLWILHEVLKHRTVKLRMVGSGPEWPACQKLASELGILQHVEFLPPTPHIEQHLMDADLLLLPSEKEGFGQVALEALSCGVPVIGTHTGGLPEVVVHPSSGILRPVGDVDGMARAVLDVLGDPVRHQGMRRSAHRRSQRFSEEHVVPEYLQMFKNLTSSLLRGPDAHLWQEIPSAPLPAPLEDL